VEQEEKICVQDFSLKIKMKRPLGRPRFRRGNSIKMDLKEMTCGGVGLNRIQVAQNKAQ
jgi:hypothetical protein